MPVRTNHQICANGCNSLSSGEALKEGHEKKLSLVFAPQEQKQGKAELFIFYGSRPARNTGKSMGFRDPNC